MADWERRTRWTVALGGPIVRAAFRAHVDGPALPTGPVVVAANHLSFVDPPLVAVSLRRPMRFLATPDLWDHGRAFTGLIEGFGTVALRGVRPLGALRIALEHLTAGGTLGIFPEGRRVRAWGAEPVRSGAAWLSVRTGSPLVPVFVQGTGATLSLSQPRFRFPAVRVLVGEPLHPDGSGRADVERLLERWRAAMDDLAGQAGTSPGP